MPFSGGQLELHNMDPFYQSIAALVLKLETQEVKDETEARTLSLLRRLFHTIGNSELENDVDDLIMQLRDHWLSRVAWCSGLSRDIEKVLITYEDLSS
jgi:hypothetical protein